MLKIDNSLLVEIGLDALPEAEKNSFLKHIYETLEMRVGIRLADQMSNEQLDEFERYFEAKDDAGAFKWLETNFPNYKDIVQQEFDKLKAEVAQTAPQILAASQAQASTQPVAPEPPIAQPAAPQPTPVVEPIPQPLATPEPVSPIPAPAPAPEPVAGGTFDPVAIAQGYQPHDQPAPVQQQSQPLPPEPPMPFQPPQPGVPEPVTPPAPQPDFPAEQPPAGPTQPQQVS